MLPVGRFRSRGILLRNAAGFLMVAALVETGVVMVQFLQTGLGFGPLGAGLRLLPGGAPWSWSRFLVAPFAGSMVSRIDGRPRIAAGLSWARLTGPAALGSFSYPLQLVPAYR